MTTEATEKLALLFETKQGTEGLRLKAYAVNVKDGRWVRGIDSSRLSGEAVSDLALTAYVNADPEKYGESYGWDARYCDVYSLDLRQLEAKAKLLRAATKRYEKSCEREGRPESFGAFVARWARMLGVEIIVVRQGEQRGSSYDDSDWRFLNLGDGQEHINHAIRKFHSERATAQKGSSAA